MPATPLAALTQHCSLFSLWLAESRKHAARQLLEQIPSIGPVRAALLIAIMQTPHRFRTKRLLWAYSGLGLEIRTSSDHDFKNGQLQRRPKQISVRALTAITTLNRRTCPQASDRDPGRSATNGCWPEA